MSEFFYVSDAKKLIAFWAPKSACTTISEWFYFGVVQGLSARPTGAKDPRIILGNEGYTKSIADYYKNDKYIDYNKIIVLRHPITRLISGYINKFVHYKRKQLSRYEDLEDIAKLIIENIYNKNNWRIDDNYRGIRFIDLLGYIEEGSKKKNKKANIDVHFRPQISEKYRSSVIKFNKICKVEQLQHDLDEINEQLGLHYILNQRNRTNYDSIPSGEKFYNSFSGDLARENILPEPISFMNEDIKRRIYNIYKIDFEIGSYNIDEY